MTTSAMSDLNTHPQADAALRMLAERARLPEHRALLAWVRQCVGAVRGTRLCEVGAGTGEHVGYWRRHAADVTVIEPAHVLGDLIEARTPGVQVVRDTAENFTPDHPLDVLVADKVLTHLRDPAAVLARWRSHTADGGRVVVTNLDGDATSVCVADAALRDVTGAVLTWRARYGTASGWAAAAAPALLTAAGWKLTTTSTHTLVVTSYQQALAYTPLHTYAAGAAEAGVITGTQAEQWLHAVRTAEPFRMLVTLRADIGYA